MRKLCLPALLASLSMFALPALAQAAGAASGADAGFVLPTSVLWAGGIAAFLGFMLGSIPPNRGEMAGWEWDSQGALLWGAAAAGIVGGGTLFLTTGNMLVGLGAVGVGTMVAIMRLLFTRPPRVPTGAPLAEGVNRAQGDTPKAKYKAAERSFKKASFQRDPNSRYFATRAPREFAYGNTGMPADDLAMVRDALAHANSETFDILVLLVRNLPGEADQAAVVVVRGAGNLRKVQVDNEGFIIPGQPKILASSIAATVGYAWR